MSLELTILLIHYQGIMKATNRLMNLYEKHSYVFVGNLETIIWLMLQIQDYIVQRRFWWYSGTQSEKGILTHRHSHKTDLNIIECYNPADWFSIYQVQLHKVAWVKSFKHHDWGRKAISPRILHLVVFNVSSLFTMTNRGPISILTIIFWSIGWP